VLQCGELCHVRRWVGLLGWGENHFQATRVAHVGSFLNQPPVSRLAGQPHLPTSLAHATSPPPLCSNARHHRGCYTMNLTLEAYRELCIALCSRVGKAGAPLHAI
jgi:hypothetical protein